MNTALQTFSFQSHQLTVITDEHGASWFIAKEVAEILEYSDAFEMTKKLDEDEVQNLRIAGFGNRGVNVINESGLWSSVLRSTKPEAKTVKKWLTSEVLPAIHKTGSYNAPNTEAQKLMEIKDQLLDSQKQLLASQQYSHEAFKEKTNAYIEHLTQQNKQLNFRANINAESNKRNREELARAVRAQRPIAAAEEKEIAEWHAQGWTVHNLAIHFYRNAGIIRRSIRNQGGTV